MLSTNKLQNRSLKVRSDGKTPLRSSINLINNSNQKLSNDLNNNLKTKQIVESNEKCEPKVSLTEQISIVESEKNKSTLTKTKKKPKDDKMKSTEKNKIKKITNKRQSVDKKRIKKAIKIVLNKDERVRRWLTSKEPIEDIEYWRLSSERLSTELKESLNHLEELELENELLKAEHSEMVKLAKNADRLNQLFENIGIYQCMKR